MKRRIRVAVAAIATLAALTGCAASTSSTLVKEPTVSTSADHPVLTTGCGVPAPFTAGTSRTATIHSAGRTRSYVIHLPADYDPATPTGLILAFHARGSSGEAMQAYTGLSTASTDVVVYPNGLVSQGERSWESAPYASGANDVEFVSDVITHLQTQLCIDPSRVFAVGKSNGGGFTGLLACDLPDRIAAFGVVSGAFYDTHGASCAHPVPTPIVEFHGTADPVIHYGGGTSHGTRYLSVDAWLQRQLGRDGCTGSPAMRRIGADVIATDWNSCSGRGDLVHYRIDGGGHTWPGAVRPSGPGHTTTTISATRVILEFFAQHPLPTSTPSA